MPQCGNLNLQPGRLEGELSSRIWEVLGSFPHLCGFALQDRTGMPDYINPAYLREDLFVTDLGFSAPVSDTEYDDAYRLITDAVADIVSERPEALDLLRGRTFARTLH